MQPPRNGMNGAPAQDNQEYKLTNAGDHMSEEDRLRQWRAQLAEEEDSDDETPGGFLLPHESVQFQHQLGEEDVRRKRVDPSAFLSRVRF